SFTRENPNDRPDVDSPQGFGTAPIVNQPADRKFLSMAWRSSWSKLVNELRGGLFTSNPIFLRTTTAPSFFIIPTLISNPEVTFEPQGRFTDLYTVQDNVDYPLGNHSLRFGEQSQFIRINSFAAFTTVPNATLGTNVNTPSISTAQFTTAALFPGGISTAQRTTANNLLALLGGIVSGEQQTFNVTNKSSGFVPGETNRQIYNFETHGLYIQDQWRARPTLTLNLGLRYDLFTALRETRGLALEPVIGNN